MSGEEFSTPAQSRTDLAEEKLEEEITGISQEEIPTTRTRRALVFEEEVTKASENDHSNTSTPLTEIEERERQITMTSTGRFASMFTENNKRSERDLDKGQVSVPRSERGTSAKDKQKMKKLATEPLLDRFGVPKHLVVGQGKAEDGILKIQDAFIGIAQRTKMLND